MPALPSVCELHTLGEMIKKSEITSRSAQEDNVKIVVENADDPLDFEIMKDLYQKSIESAQSPVSK